MQTDPETKRLIRYIILSIGALILVSTVVWFFSNSFITIKTPSANAEISISQNGIVTKSLKGASVFTSVSPGSYTISVKEGIKMSTRYVQVGGGQFHTYSYTLKDVNQTQNISAVRANSLYLNGPNLNYVDLNQEANGYITASSTTISRSANDLRFSQIAWNREGKGIGLSSTLGTEETSSNVTSINGGALVNYPLPSGTENKSQSIAIAPNGTGWFAGGNLLFQQNGPELKKIYEAKHNITLLAATNTSALILEAINSDGDSLTMQLVSIRLDGSESRGESVSFHADPNLSLSGTYSPDGTHIILTSMGTGIIYTSDLKRVDQLPLQTTITSATWEDNSTILYATENNILAYSVETKTANTVGVSEQGSTITGLTYDTTSQAVAMSVLGSDSSDSIQLIKLVAPSMSITSAMQTLATYLPREYTMLSCRVNYNTLNSPTVLIEQRMSMDNEQNARDCEDAIKQTFEQVNINPSQFTYIKLLP
jgi:hypothetical protein